MKEKLARFIAWKLPMIVVYWASIRLISYATSTPPFADQEVGKITAMQALGQWPMKQ
jgi:hypothetical protein